MSRKIPDYRHVILNLIQNLPELGDASPKKIHSRSTRSLSLPAQPGDYLVAVLPVQPGDYSVAVLPAPHRGAE